jgi:hypothetical protein
MSQFGFLILEGINAQRHEIDQLKKPSAHFFHRSCFKVEIEGNKERKKIKKITIEKEN